VVGASTAEDVRPPLTVDEKKLEVCRDLLNFVPHSGQRPVVLDNHRGQVVAGGRRVGKTMPGGKRLAREALNTYSVADAWKAVQKRREFWIVGPEYSDAEKEFRIAWDTLKRLDVPFDKPGSYNDPISGNMHISLWDGTFQLHGKSAKYPGTLVGEGVSGVILAEAAKLKESVWVKYVRPTLADFKGWWMATSTPEGKNWFYRLFMDGLHDDLSDSKAWRIPSWMNPHVYPLGASDAGVAMLVQALEQGNLSRDIMEECGVDPEIVSLAQDLTPEAFEQEIGAGFSAFVGRVFEFDEEVHVKKVEHIYGWETYGAVDYGFTNPNVWLLLQLGPWGEVHILDEVYEVGLTDQQFADEIKRRGLCPPDLIRFYPDPSDPGATRVLSETLKKGAGGGTGGERRHRIDGIRALLKIQHPHLPFGHPERVPRLVISPRCTRLISDMSEYRYPKTAHEAAQMDKPAPEEPMKKDDHGPEALGRFVAGRLGTPQRNVRRARVSKADLASS
jgi:Terminase large subunit, T4likevirus-type, N-terminal